MRKNIPFLLIPLFIVCYKQSGFSQSVTKPDSTDARADKSMTRHAVKIDGKLISYMATAGTLVLKNEKDEPIALFGFTAYVKDGEPVAATRPIVFAYNGGPAT